MVLRRGKRNRALAVAEREERGFLAFQKILDHDFRTRLSECAAENHVDGRFRLVHGLGHHDALSSCQPVSFYDDGGAALAGVGFGGFRVGKALVIGGGD